MGCTWFRYQVAQYVPRPPSNDERKRWIRYSVEAFATDIVKDKSGNSSAPYCLILVMATGSWSKK
jgi:hypothetical protein